MILDKSDANKDLVLGRRLEAADAVAAAQCARILAARRGDSESVVLEVAGGCAIYAGPDSPLTEVRNLGMSGAVSSADLDELEAFFAARGSPIHIEVCPLADGSLLEQLKERGYREGERSHALVRRARDGLPPVRDGAVEVRRVLECDVRAWAEVVSSGFADGGPFPRDFVELAEACYYLPDTACFLALIDGQAAGGGSVSMFDGLAALYGQSTLPPFRGRGVQGAVIRASLVAAEDAGCDLAMIATLPETGSQRNAERYGFRVAYTRTKKIREE